MKPRVVPVVYDRRTVPLSLLDFGYFTDLFEISILAFATNYHLLVIGTNSDDTVLSVIVHLRGNRLKFILEELHALHLKNVFRTVRKGRVDGLGRDIVDLFGECVH